MPENFDALFGLGRPTEGSVHARNARINPHGRWNGPALLALHQLAHGARPVEAAVDAGVSVVTLRKWLDDPEYQEAVDRARAALFEPLRAEIKSSLSDAFHVIRGHMYSGDERLAQKAAEYVIDRFGRSIADVATADLPPAVQVTVDMRELESEARRRWARISGSIVDTKGEKDGDVR